MAALYVASSETAGGSTAICAGIGKKLTGLKRVGFLIPARFPKTAGTLSDAVFFKEAFQLPEEAEQICPLVLSPAELWQCLTDDLSDFSHRLQQIYREITQDRDIVIMEGPGNIVKDKVSELACYTIPEVLGAEVIIVVRYIARQDTARVIQVCKKLGERLLGVVINVVPEPKIEWVKQDIARQFQESGIHVLGVLPRVRSLLGITVADLNQVVGGELLFGNGNRDAIIENIMLGAMTPGSGIDYFAHKANKAVIARADRPDMQLAALQTSVRCLVLADATTRLSPDVLFTAEAKRVPIIVTGKNIPQIIADVEKALQKVSFAHPEKLRRLSEVMESHFDFATLRAKLGIDTR